MLTAALLSVHCLASSPELSMESSEPTSEAALDALLAEAQRTTRLWHWTWTGLFAGQVAARGVLAGVADAPEDREAQLLATIPLGVGLVFSFAQPARSLQAVRLGAAIDARHPEDLAARLRAKKTLVRELARDERRVSGWLPRLAGFALNLGAAGGIWAVTGEPLNGALQLGIGTVVNESKLQTAPRTLRAAKRHGELHTRIRASRDRGIRFVGASAGAGRLQLSFSF